MISIWPTRKQEATQNMPNISISTPVLQSWFCWMLRRKFLGISCWTTCILLAARLYAACTMYTACILLVYCLYIPCMLLVHCTQLVYCLHTTCMLLVHSTRLVYFLYNVHCLYTTCILLAATSLPHCTVLICGIASSLPAQNCLFEHSVFSAKNTWLQGGSRHP